MRKTAASPILHRRARRMRHDMTPAELRFWNAVRAHRLMGLGFRRQMVIDRYIVDFACPACRLIVEIDGAQHGEEAHMARDRLRTEALEAAGWTLIRFWNDDVLKDIDGVCAHVLAVVDERRNGT